MLKAQDYKKRVGHYLESSSTLGDSICSELCLNECSMVKHRLHLNTFFRFEKNSLLKTNCVLFLVVQKLDWLVLDNHSVTFKYMTHPLIILSLS